jgi:hypothetical protein
MHVALCGIPYIQFPQYWKANQPVRLDLQAFFILSSSVFPSMMLNRLVMVAARVSDDSELLSGKVGAECDGGYSEARERALEALEAGEGACVPPLLTVDV